jgi:tol-pal system protein YbgF
MMRAAGKLGFGAVAAVLFVTSSAFASTASADDAPRAQRTKDQVRVAALFGESDDEKAARQQHEDNQDLATQALSQRVHDLEESLRQQTGQNEALTHQVQELNAKVERQQKDFEYRLCALAAQQLGATGGQQGQPALPCGAGGPVAGNQPPPTGGSQAPPSGDQPGKSPGVLGSLSPNDTAPAASAQPSGPRAQFDGAMNLLSKAQYDEARAGFRAFADANPRDPLAPQAVYWIGRVAYVQKDYPGAARAFAEVIKKYPTSANAAESMLKLGQSLLAAGQKKEGCTALVALKKKYPGAGKSLIGQAASARRAACVR